MGQVAVTIKVFPENPEKLEEVKEAVKSALVAAARDGGFIMAMTNSHNAVKVENTRWMIEFTHRYGTYPLGLD